MQRERQQQPAPETSGLGSWVSSDSHFVPARRMNPDAAPPPRPPLFKTATAAISLLGFGRLASDHPRPSGSYGGGSSAAAQAAAPPGLPSTNYSINSGSGGVLQPADDGSGLQSAAGSPSNQAAAAPKLATAAAVATAAPADAHRSWAKLSPGGGGSGSDGHYFWWQSTRHDGGGSHTRGGVVLGRTTPGASPEASGLPETPSLRSPEWSPRRRSRSLGSAPSPSSLLPASATAAIAPAAAGAAARTPLMPAAVEPRRKACADSAGQVLLPHGADAGHERDAEGHVGVGTGGAPVWAQAEGGREWGLVEGSSGAGAGAGSEGGCRSGDGGGGPDAGRVSCASNMHSQGALTAAAAAAQPPHGSDSRDLSFVLGILGAVRCIAKAVRGMDATGSSGAAPNAGHCSGQPGSSAGSSSEGFRHQGCKGGDLGAAAAFLSGGIAADLTAYDKGSGGGGSQVQSAGLNTAAAAAAVAAAGGGADSAAALTSSAVVAAPTSVLLLVLAVRLLRAAKSWPVVALLCAAAAAVLAAWLAAAAAFFAVAGAAGRTAHRLAQIAWAVTAWCLGSRVALVAGAAAGGRPEMSSLDTVAPPHRSQQ
ncbi:hypothetical protein PLESTB_001093300 [Pleodorina starrii]|uniref:Uncharacterized protein n=1 Tax=Pleodorina starrii TaxID=330485 RepID=A0A9W6BRS2_9CHLO|nr:hypothetical protein PLESTM_000693200 [Pleodorina starrii]GLC56331.1 hypothetical protein PLESTB_001093300 [Pleodorina starrii]GLC77173.1 hypothetical protein PLESTF_001894200 [Pleodorina starrii]